MGRQFFVGGNFKMNPCTRDDKKALLKILNEADIDPSTGALYRPIFQINNILTRNMATCYRGRNIPPIALLDPYHGDAQERYQGCGPELLLQIIWSVYRRDQVSALAQRAL